MWVFWVYATCTHKLCLCNLCCEFELVRDVITARRRDTASQPKMKWGLRQDAVLYLCCN